MPLHCMVADGGLVANDPTKYCLSEVKALWPNRPIGVLVSIGCGTPIRAHVSSVADTSVKGLAWWASTILKNAIVDGSVREETEMALRFHNPPGQPQPEYFRFNPAIPETAFPPSNEMVHEMRKATEAYIGSQDVGNKLKEAASRLLALAHSRTCKVQKERPECSKLSC